MHQLALPEKPYERYDAYQEREQLDKTLRSLMDYYNDNKGRMVFQNEAEFRAYQVIFRIQDPIPDLEDQVNNWEEQIKTDSRVKIALDLYAGAQSISDQQGPLRPRAAHVVAQQDWNHVFTIVGSHQLSYLMSCICEVYFTLARRTALEEIWRGFKRAGSNMAITELTLDVVTDLLCFDDPDQAEEFCEQNGFPFKEPQSETSQPFIDLNSVPGKKFPDPSPELRSQIHSFRLVESKRYGRTLPAIINGITVEAARRSAMVEEEDEPMEQMIEDEDSLFVPPNPIMTDKPAVLDNNSVTEFASTPSGAFSWGKPSAEGTTAFSKPASPPVASSPFGQGSATSTFGKPSPGTTSSPFAVNPAAPTTSPFALSNTATPSVFASKPVTSSTFGRSPFAAAATEPSKHYASEPPAAAPSDASSTVSSFQKQLPSFGFPSQPDTLKSTSGNSIFSTQPQQPDTKATVPDTFIPHTQEKSAPAAGKSPFSFSTAPFSSKTTLEAKSTTPRLSSTPPAPVEAPPLVSMTGTVPKQTAAKTLSNPFGSTPTPSVVSHSTTTTFGSDSGSTTPKPAFGFPNPSASSPSNVQKPFGSTIPPQPNQPKKPSPLARSFSPEAESGKDAAKQPTTGLSEKQIGKSPDTVEQAKTNGLAKGLQFSSSEFATKQPSPAVPNTPAPPPPAKVDVLQLLAEDVTLNLDRGLLKQWVEYYAQATIMDVFNQVEKESMREQADTFRRETLMYRYGKRWREVCWHLRLARQGREKRRRIKRNQEQREVKKREAAKVNAVDEFLRMSQAGLLNRSVRDGSLTRGSLASTGQETPAREMEKGASKIDSVLFATSRGSKRPTSAHGSQTATVAGADRHKRMKSTSHLDDGGRVSKPSPAPSTISNRSLLGVSLHGSRYDAPLKSTTTSNYFRLKAMGINPGGATITSNGARKRGIEEASAESLMVPPPKRSRTPPKDSSSQASARARSQSIQSQASAMTFATDAENPIAVKPLSRTQEEDETLFARARAARAALADSAAWYKSEVQKNQLGESQRSDSFTNSPSMRRAREEARNRASQDPDFLHSVTGRGATSNVPAYRLRESRFVPREQYGKAIERSRQMIESRSRPQSQTGIYMAPTSKQSSPDFVEARSSSHTLGRSQQLRQNTRSQRRQKLEQELSEHESHVDSMAAPPEVRSSESSQLVASPFVPRTKFPAAPKDQTWHREDPLTFGVPAKAGDTASGLSFTSVLATQSHDTGIDIIAANTCRGSQTPPANKIEVPVQRAERSRSVSQAPTNVISLVSDDEDEHEKLQPAQPARTYPDPEPASLGEHHYNLQDLASDSMSQFREMFDHEQNQTSLDAPGGNEVTYSDQFNGLGGAHEQHVQGEEPQGLRSSFGDPSLARHSSLFRAKAESDEGDDAVPAIDPALTNGHSSLVNNMYAALAADSQGDNEAEEDDAESASLRDEDHEGYSDDDQPGQGVYYRYSDDEGEYDDEGEEGYDEEEQDDATEGEEDYDEEEEIEDDGTVIRRPTPESHLTNGESAIKGGTGTAEDAFELSD